MDLVQTGSTLAANGLRESEVIAHVSSRLIVNRTALKTQPEAIGAWIERFRAALRMRRLATADAGFDAAFDALLDQSRETTARWTAPVAAIIADVRARGDAALCELTQPLDHHAVTAATLRIAADEIDAAANAIPPELTAALDLAATRIEAFHRLQMPPTSRRPTRPGCAWACAGRRSTRSGCMCRAARRRIRRRC